MNLWKVFEMEELMGILEDIAIAIQAAQKAVDRNDIPTVLYNVDHAEIDIMRARNLTVSLFYHGEKGA
jgi:hypothetical protein